MSPLYVYQLKCNFYDGKEGSREYTMDHKTWNTIHKNQGQ